jgi:sugar lactone lactonase YvrE
MDAADHLWVAVWGAGRVLRLSPEGQVVGVVEVDAPHTSSVAFAGPDLDTLVITTARQDLSDEQLTTFPLSGALFTVRCGITGAPVPRCLPLPRG